jgi:hypothetical protein
MQKYRVPVMPTINLLDEAHEAEADPAWANILESITREVNRAADHVELIPPHPRPLSVRLVYPRAEQRSPRPLSYVARWTLNKLIPSVLPMPQHDQRRPPCSGINTLGWLC